MLRVCSLDRLPWLIDTEIEMLRVSELLREEEVDIEATSRDIVRDGLDEMLTY